MAEDSTQPPHATRFIETTRGILSYAQLAPLLAERVLQVQQDITDSVYAARELDEPLLLDLHRGVCGDLTPGWAGRFRDAEVRVGEHHPPPPYRVPQLMRDYFADLNARIQSLPDASEPLLLELLAFAEGRLLSIHPFADFNGRVTRLFLAELLRRLELPDVELAPEERAKRARYLASLRAADQLMWQPLIEIWQARLAASP
jgi:CRISPR-associated endonuclease/helicase Cas3